MTGKIHRLIKDKRYGFIRDKQNNDYFFFKSAMKNCKFEDLEVGMDVEFEDSETDKGLRAEDIYV